VRSSSIGRQHREKGLDGMTLLLDTHTHLWFLADERKLATFAKTALEDPANARWLTP
jgi:hypothetical protein